MKVLILSFLRIGDAILHQELIDSLRATHANCEVHFAYFEEFKVIESLMMGVKKFLPLSRQMLLRAQRGENISWALGLNTLSRFVTSTNNENYNLILNATHTQASACLMSLLKSKDKRGAEIGKNQTANKDYQYFNDVFSLSHEVNRSYLEALAKTLHIDLPAVRKIEKRTGKKIMFQISTSDQKKNWQMDSWKVVFAGLLSRGYEIEILAAANEIAALQTEFAEFTRITYNDTALGKLRSEFRNARLLVSLDTSVIHLAAQSRTPTLGIYLGGANPLKTAPRLSGAQILSANVPCHPCYHSEACTQTEHLCSIKLSPYDVLNVIYCILEASPIFNLRAKLWKVSQSGFPQEVKHVPGTREAFEAGFA